MHLRRAVVLLCVLLGCDPGPGSRTEALSADRAPPEVGADEILLDTRSDGARLVGQVLAAPENADPERLLRVRLEQGGRTDTLEQPLLDARFVGARILAIDDSHELRVLGDPDAVVDTDAEPPLAVRGSTVAYARGEMPFFEIAVADLRTGARRTITEGYAPAWSPAFDEDGSVVFASSREGSPRLYRVSMEGQVTALPRTTRTPSSPRAPRIVSGRLVFEDELGTASIELATGHLTEGAAP